MNILHTHTIGERQVHEERWKVAAEAAASTSNTTSSLVRTLKEITLETPIRYNTGIYTYCVLYMYIICIHVCMRYIDISKRIYVLHTCILYILCILTLHTLRYLYTYTPYTPYTYTGDSVEKWLNGLLCLDMTTYNTRLVNIMPAPKDCDLYIVNRDALFSYHSLSELLLQRIWSLYTSAHYKNTPNDLQMLSDAPAHRLFILLGPQTNNNSSTTLTSTNNNNTTSSNTTTASNNKPAVLPDILCIVQVAYEGYISKSSIQSELLKANKASGDLST